MKIGTLLKDPKYKEKFVLQKLLCMLLNCTREHLWTDVDRELDNEMVQKIMSMYDDYVVRQKPLEYVLGHVDFFGREFIVNEATLIPRPETEYMITAVKEYVDGQLKIENGKGMEGVLLDVGTGCGVLGISVLLQNPGFFTEAIFTDYYANALEVAKKNFQLLVTGYKGRVKFIESDLLDFLKSSTTSWSPSFEIKEEHNIVLVANLPYIPEEAFEKNVGDNVKKWEPKPAFVGGDDGLDYYRRMFGQILTLVEGRKYKVENIGEPSTFHLPPFTMFLEMMTWQVDILRQEFGDRIEFEEVKTFHFNIRIVKAWVN